MRIILIAALAAGLATSASADLIARNADNELRLTNSPCTNAAVLSTLKAEWHDKFKAAQATVDGKFFYACWIDTEQGAYFVKFDDGDALIAPVDTFKLESGI